MDEPPIIDDPDAEEPQDPAEVEEAPRPKASAAPPPVVLEGLASGKEPWRGGSGCSNRLPLYGCLIGLLLVIGVLFAGTSMMRRTVWVNMDRGRRAVVQQLPRNLPAAERQRTIQNLERFRSLLEATKDPYPAMGEFMNRARDILKDGRLTIDEVGGLNVYIERVIEESGIPLMQLGAEIRNSEFGIRKAAHALSPLNFTGRVGGNPKLKTQNSKFV
jgi:hypothetical protein